MKTVNWKTYLFSFICSSVDIVRHGSTFYRPGCLKSCSQRIDHFWKYGVRSEAEPTGIGTGSAVPTFYPEPELELESPGRFTRSWSWSRILDYSPGTGGGGGGAQQLSGHRNAGSGLHCMVLPSLTRRYIIRQPCEVTLVAVSCTSFLKHP